ncbi:MAG: hypothetical protein JO301_02680 [Chitinophagaceae bacterium]|nr:hypothetical protein [Chitinophagaceae bacterium]
MKKFTFIGLIAVAVIAFTYCSPSKKATVANLQPALTTYDANVAPILAANCAPCHFPEKGGNKKPLDSYNGASAQIDDVLKRVQLNPTDRGFMPQRHPKLSDSTINVLKKWKADGLVK